MIAALVVIGLVSWYERMPPHEPSQNSPARRDANPENRECIHIVIIMRVAWYSSRADAFEKPEHEGEAPTY